MAGDERDQRFYGAGPFLEGTGSGIRLIRTGLGLIAVLGVACSTSEAPRRGPSLGATNAPAGGNSDQPPLASDGSAATGGRAATGDPTVATPWGSVQAGGNDGLAGETLQPVFSLARGIYAEPFDLHISHPLATTILYSLDASDPRTSSTAVEASLPLVLRVDPSDPRGRFRSPVFIVRATVGGARALPQAVVTHSYLFLNRVVELSPDQMRPGAAWPPPPSPGRNSRGQIMDYGMDPEVTQASEYAAQMDAALASLPSISLVTDLENLFDATRGIYLNADGKGREWERFASIELLRPDQGSGFQANAGLRIRGGVSRGNHNPKHAFRLFFRGEYGLGRLRYPLFDEEGASNFDKLDLRTAQNYSWSMDGGADYNLNTMTRDVFSRDLQRELGRPYTRSRYYHLYLDGVYWGLYQSEERPEAEFAETYLGGASSDYDVVKVERGGGVGMNVITATDGTLDTWQLVWQACQSGFESDFSVHRLEGRGPDGQRDPALPILVDLDNLIDFVLVLFYTANFDGSVSKWFRNHDPNNFFAIKSRTDPERGFVFVTHDNEHSLIADRVTITTGINENRINIGRLGGATDGSGRASEAYRMNVTDFRFFHPEWLHFRLSANAGYRARFAARARTLLGEGGLLTPERARELFERRTREIELAIIAESARWGDAKRPDAPRTKNLDWAAAVARVVDGFFPARTQIVTQQLQAEGLY